MTCFLIDSHLTVEEQHKAFVVESLHNLFDSFVLGGMAVLDAEVNSTMVCDVDGADEVKRELRELKRPVSRARSSPGRISRKR